MINKIKSLFKPKETPVLETKTIGGHIFRVLDPIKMPKIRQAAIYMGEYERDWGMTKQHLLAYDDILVKETDFPTDWANKDDLTAQLTNKLKKLYDLINTRRLLIQEDFQYTPFLKAACYMILIDDENPNAIDPVHNNKKLALCQSNEEILIFFLRVIRAFQQNTLYSSGTLETSEFLPGKHLLPTEKKVLRQINTTPFLNGHT